MKIIIDSREQLPLHFNDTYVTEVRTDCLPFGDYGCEYLNGYECPIVFERKSIPDLFGTLSKGYERFKRELEKAKQADLKLILIIEGTLSDVYRGCEYSKRNPFSVVKQIFTLWVRYDLYPVFCKDRHEMSRFIIETYTALGRKALEDIKTGKK